MDLIAEIPNLRGGHLSVHHDTGSGTLIIGGRQLDLAGIAALAVALDDGVEAIRAAEDENGGG